MTFLIAVMSFANFVFYPLVIGTIIAVIIEQILRSVGNEYDPKAVKKVETASRVRKFLWRQNLILNFSWFVCYFLLMIMLRSTPNAPMPDMIWQG